MTTRRSRLRALAGVLLLSALAVWPAAAEDPALASVGLFPILSAEGRFLAFYSRESSVTGGAEGEYHLLVHDRLTGSTDRVALAYPAAEERLVFTWHWWPSISADGRYVAFVALPPPSEQEPAPTYHVFVHDRLTGASERITRPGSPDDDPILYSYSPVLSADGRYVTFAAYGGSIVPGDSNGTSDVFVFDRKKRTTERVSVTNDGRQITGLSYAPSISADGRHVAFASYASNVVAGDTNGGPDVFIRDRLLGRTERVSVTTGGGQANADAVYGSYSPALSADGRFVAFGSLATNLVPGDTQGTSFDVFVHDRLTRVTERVSVATDGACVPVEGVCAIPNAGTPYAPNAISADGRFVAFAACCASLSADDAAGHDLFVHDRLAVTTTRVTTTASTSQTTGSMSGDGRVVAFTMFGDSEPAWGLYARRLGPALGIATLSATRDGSGVSVAGTAAFAAVPVIGAPDPIDAPTGGNEAGGELLEASIVGRPGRGDLLVRLRLASIPYVYRGQVNAPTFQVVQASPGNPGIVYGLAMTVDGTRYEVRAMRAQGTELTTDLPLWPAFVLYRCELVCTRVRRVPGSLGQTGTEAVFSIPLADVGGLEGSRLTAIRAFVGLGDAAPGALVKIDEVPLSNTTAPIRLVHLGIAPAGTPQDDVDFSVPTTVSAGGAFTGSLDVSALAPGDYEVWARACLGAACGSSSVPLAVGA